MNKKKKKRHSSVHSDPFYKENCPMEENKGNYQSEVEDLKMDSNFVAEVALKLNKLKRGWDLFKDNRDWIVSLLFVFSVLYAVLYYGCFGINALEYLSIADIFIIYAEFCLQYIVLVPFGIILFILPDGRSGCTYIASIAIKIIVFCCIALFVTVLMRFENSLLVILCQLSLFLVMYLSNKRKELTYIILLFATLFSLQPIEKRLRGENRTALIDRFSFTYLGRRYDLSDVNMYYYIGGSSNYYFIQNKKEHRIEILPRSECTNIVRKDLSWKSLWKEMLSSPSNMTNRRVRKCNVGNCKKQNMVMISS